MKWAYAEEANLKYHDGKIPPSSMTEDRTERLETNLYWFELWVTDLVTGNNVHIKLAKAEMWKVESMQSSLEWDLDIHLLVLEVELIYTSAIHRLYYELDSTRNFVKNNKNICQKECAIRIIYLFR